jgi:hypothetical protein
LVIPIFVQVCMKWCDHYMSMAGNKVLVIAWTNCRLQFINGAYVKTYYIKWGLFFGTLVIVSNSWLTATPLGNCFHQLYLPLCLARYVAPLPHLEQESLHLIIEYCLSKQRMYSNVRRHVCLAHICRAVQVLHLETLAGFPECCIE